MKKTKIETGSDFNGVGAFDQALGRMEIEQRKVFACDIDKYARKTFVLNFGTKEDIALADTKEHDKLCDKFGKIMRGDFQFRTPQKEVEFYKYAEAFANRFSFYFPFDVYNRTIPEKPLGIYMTSPPCQAFSLAGNRNGEEDKRGILFYNSHEFIKQNKPEAFIFENVKGLLSDDNGRTFGKWKEYLGGKSINGMPTIFPHPEAVPYHIYYFVLNARKQGIPQNRERVFIVGIRDDEKNKFSIPKEIPLTKFLEDVLENNVDEKYFLSEKMLDWFNRGTETQKEKGNGFAFNFKSRNDKYSNSITTRSGARKTDNFLVVDIEVGTWRTHEDGRGFRKTKDNICPTIPARAREDGSGQPVVVLKYKRTEEAKTARREEMARTGRDSGKFSDRQMEAIDQPYADTILANANPKKENLILQLGAMENETEYFYGRIRRFTPLECFRCMDFNDNFKWLVSDAQAYKQAGNSIPVGLLVQIIEKILGYGKA